MSTPKPRIQSEGVAFFDPRVASMRDARNRRQLIKAFARVLDSGHYILGQEVNAFEALMKEMTHAGHTVGVSSGSDALSLAMMALNIGPGDDVIVPATTFFASAGSIARLGARPRFADVCPRCLTLLPSEIQRLQSPLSRAVMPVHLFGLPAQMDAITQHAKALRLAVIEDAAQAFGAQYKSRPVGSMGDVGAFSFFPTKNLGGFGDGGLVTCQKEALAKRMVQLRNHGASRPYVHDMLGGNFRLDAMHAALLHVQAQHHADDLIRRRACATRYDSIFRNNLDIVDVPCLCLGGTVKKSDKQSDPKCNRLKLPDVQNPTHTFNQYVIQFTSPQARKHTQAALMDQGVGHALYYPVPLHLQPCFAYLGGYLGQLPHSEWAAQTTLALPLLVRGQTQIDKVARTVIKSLRQQQY